MNARRALAGTIVAAATLMLTLRAEAARPEVTSLGVEGRYFLRTEVSDLVARPGNGSSPLLLRITSRGVDGKAVYYELGYIGTVAGGYDLRDYLQHASGAAFTEAPPASVQIIGTLSKDHDGQLEELAPPPRSITWPYRLLFQGALAMWIVATLVIMTGRMLKQRRPTKATPLAVSAIDPLTPLLEAALAGSLDAAGQARLEMLLLANWIRALGLDDVSAAVALGQLRSHPEAGPLLRQLETWLHSRAGANAAEVTAFLSACRRGPRLTGVAS